jgi:hypothetical protein
VAPPYDIYPAGHGVSVANVVDGQNFPGGHIVQEAWPAIA